MERPEQIVVLGNGSQPPSFPGGLGLLDEPWPFLDLVADMDFQFLDTEAYSQMSFTHFQPAQEKEPATATLDSSAVRDIGIIQMCPEDQEPREYYHWSSYIIPSNLRRA